MSVRSEWEDIKDLLKPVIAPMFKASALLHSGAFLETFRTETNRDLVPEPFDVVDHLGNFEEATWATLGAFTLIGILNSVRPLLERGRENFRRNVVRASVAAFTLSSALQIAAENYELTMDPNSPNTGDILDAAYGIGWSGVVAVGACYLAVSTERKSFNRQQANMIPITNDVYAEGISQ